MKPIIESFAESLKRLEEVLDMPLTMVVRDATIQRFEFTVELAWKSLQKFLREEEIVCRSPKECFKEGFKFGLIEDNPLWIQMMEDRNLTAHTYNEITAVEIFGRIPNYLPLFKALREKLTAEVEFR
jgi:nucleotidyltransferase substrate binding protein (TIGR01987 family)